ncbi:hypothetical protein [Pelagibacterium lacus]|uniref:DUF2946 domain-containing protein n=1 Tax=Pelagibacterium lacus TaxID=2282655 RepID=A0A369W8V7_9HYPH|nr:hypothetical protein [Pelagibacterium lacus]RDE10497.1 hypothetical protein DVH29_00660 [Pelagibacterium lacus]
MFLVRSAFWLTGAFLLMAPSAGMDLGQSARATGADLTRQGTSAVIGQIEAQDCASLECSIGRQLVIGALTTPVAPQPALAEPPSPALAFPPPRPAWAY